MPETGYTSDYRMQKLVAVVFIGCMMIIFLSGFDMIKAKVRDTKRRADIKILTKALELYHDNYGRYPESINDWQGWDLSINYGGNDDFIGKLKRAGLMDRQVKDPVNDAAYHYRYQLFPAGDYGCQTSFYILQITNFELTSADNGRGECPEFNWTESVPNGYTAQGFN